jgi:hypothetical protein
MGLKLSGISLVEGDKIGCSEVHLLHMTSEGHMVSAIIYYPEVDDVQKGLPCESLELRVMSAMSRLKMMLEP